MKTTTNLRQLNCAIYTRKSTEEGLEQEFNTLDAQRESAECYIKSQEAEGWVCLPEHYDDGGYTGGNMERPALKRLLTDIEAGKVDCVIVYKVDRLSRSLMDFAKMLEVFERKRVAFVSVTQQFNTTNSMGRLTCLLRRFHELTLVHRWEVQLHRRNPRVWVAIVVEQNEGLIAPCAAFLEVHRTMRNPHARLDARRTLQKANPILHLSSETLFCLSLPLPFLF